MASLSKEEALTNLRAILNRYPNYKGPYATDMINKNTDASLLDDDDVMNLAIQIHGSLLEYGSERIRNDEAIALTALNQSGYGRPAWPYIGDKAKSHLSVMIRAVEKGTNFDPKGDEFQRFAKNKEFAKAVGISMPYCIEHLDPSVQEIAREADKTAKYVPLNSIEVAEEELKWEKLIADLNTVKKIDKNKGSWWLFS